MSIRKKMARARSLTLAAGPSYAAMSDDELADYARDQGVIGVPHGWPRKTIIRKIEELKA